MSEQDRKDPMEQKDDHLTQLDENNEPYRVTLKVKHHPITATTERWAKLKHKSPLYNSSFSRDFMILNTRARRKAQFKYIVTQHIELDSQNEEDVLAWMKRQDSVAEVTVHNRRNTQ